MPWALWVVGAVVNALSINFGCQCLVILGRLMVTQSDLELLMGLVDMAAADSLAVGENLAAQHIARK